MLSLHLRDGSTTDVTTVDELMGRHGPRPTDGLVKRPKPKLCKKVHMMFILILLITLIDRPTSDRHAILGPELSTPRIPSNDRRAQR